MKTFFSFLLALSLILPVQAQEKNYDELRISLIQEFDTLNQITSTMLVSVYVYFAVGRSLLILDKNGKWTPMMAEKIPTLENGGAQKFTDNGKEKIKAVWTIKEKAKWSDGTPVTCADFKLALDISLSPNITVATKDDYSLVENITWDPKAPKVCTFTYAEARWDYYQIGRFTPMPNHLERPIFEKYKSQKEGYEKNTLYTREPTRSGLYNGPYKVSEIVPGSHVVLVPNPEFWGTAPKFKKIIVKIIPNTGTLEANVMTGAIQIVGPVGFSVEQALDFEKRVKSQNPPFEFRYVSSLSFEHLDFDTETEELKDLKVRKALLYGLDRETMVKSFFEGKQPVAHFPVASLDPWYPKSNKGLTTYPYNRRLAQKLLDEAGWKLNNSDGYRYKNGKKLSLRFTTTAGNKSREMLQVYIQKQWKDMGIETHIKNESARLFFSETLKKKLYDGVAMFAWTTFPERSFRAFYHSESIPTEKNGWSGKNTVSWVNKKSDALVDKMDVEFNPKKRAQLAFEFLKEYTQDIPSMPLFYRTEVQVIPKGLKNFNQTGHIYFETNEIENWSW